MQFKSILKLDYAELHYQQFLFNTAVYGRIPFRVMCFDSGNDCMTIVIFSKTMNGATTTRHLRFSRDGAEIILKKIEDDFNLTAEVM